MDPLIGTIQAFAFSFAPDGWVLCWGQTLPVAQYQALFALLGTTFGGDGKNTFGVPDLRGRTIIGVGNGTSVTSPVDWGEKYGSETTPINSYNMPPHAHQLVSGNGSAGTVKITTTVTTVNNGQESNESDNGANGLGTGGNMESIYRESPSGTDSIGGVTSSINGATTQFGVTQPAALTIRNPYLGVYYCIAIDGYFPPRPY